MPKLDIRHMELKKQSFDGIYRGVIENNNDPDKLGRVQVRIMGIHNISKSEKDGIPTEKLPWAEPCLGLFEGSISGYGAFSIPLNGSHVFIFFEGGNWECPRYFATSPGKPTSSPIITKGFNDPDGIFPNKINEPDINRLARGDDLSKTIIQYKSDNRVKSIQSVREGTSWDELDSIETSKPEYPNNIVISTHTGITIELDNTPNSTRLHAFHPSGSYIEIDNDGNITFKNNKDRFDITRGDYKKTSNSEDINVQNDQYTFIGGEKITEIVTDDILRVGQNQSNTIGLDYGLDVGGEVKMQSEGNWTITSNANVNINAENITLNANGTLTLIGGRVDINPQPPSKVTVEVDGEIIVIDNPRDAWAEFTEDNIDIPEITDGNSGEEIPPLAGPTPEINIYTSTSGIIGQIRTAIDVTPDTEEPVTPSLIGTTGTGHVFNKYAKPTGQRTAYTGNIDVSLTPLNLDYSVKVTNNFTLGNLTYGSNAPQSRWSIKGQDVKRGGIQYTVTPESVLDNLRILASQVLEPINSKFPGLQINSAFRWSSYKGNAGSSDHPWGSAADIMWKGVRERDLFERAQWIYNELYGYVGQVILEYGAKSSMWIHVSALHQSNLLDTPSPKRTGPLTFLGGSTYKHGFHLYKFIPGKGAGNYLGETYVS